jgi:hypothetical protein
VILGARPGPLVDAMISAIQNQSFIVSLKHKKFIHSDIYLPVIETVIAEDDMREVL